MNSKIAWAGIVVALLTALPRGYAEDKMDLQQKNKIHLECERLIYLFLEAFESEHSKVADLMSDDGEAFGAIGPDAIRERSLPIETGANR